MSDTAAGSPDSNHYNDGTRPQGETASARLLEPALQLVRHYPMNQSQALISDSDPQVVTRSDLRQYILDCVGLTEQDFTRPDARFPAERFIQVLDALSQATGNERIVLNLAEATQPRMLGSIGFLMTTAPTLDQAFSSLADYLSLLFEGLELVIDQDDDLILLTLDASGQPARVIEYFTACLLNWPRWLIGYQLPVIEVCLINPAPDYETDYQRFFAAEVVFNASCNRLTVQTKHWHKVCQEANAEMYQLHQEFADALLSKQGQKSALNARIRGLIRQKLMEQGESVRREEIAAAIGMSLRTLQRKLGETGTNFQQIYDQTRKAFCLQLVERDQLSFGEIAFQLGFSNQSAFQKAFKRWFAMPPSHYRRQLKPISADNRVVPENNYDDVRADLSELLAQLDNLVSGFNQFCQEMLKRAAVAGERFDLHILAEQTGNPLARLVVNLWPAEQNGLITLEQKKHDQVFFCFNDASLRSALYQRLDEATKYLYHLEWGKSLFDRLPPVPALDNLAEALFHLNRGFQAHTDAGPIRERDSKEIKTERAVDTDSQPVFWLEISTASFRTRLFQLNSLAALRCQQQQNFDQASRYLTQAGRYLTQETVLPYSDNSDTVAELDVSALKKQLLLQKAELKLSAGQPDNAELCLQQLSDAFTVLTAEEQLQSRLILSRVFQFRGWQDKALELLLLHLEHLELALPDQQTHQLSFLLSRLQQICVREYLIDDMVGAHVSAGPLSGRQASQDHESVPDHADAVADIHHPETPASIRLLTLQLLQQVSLLARQQGQPLLTACAISRMTEMCLNDNSEDTQRFRSFTFISYAWVASWFCADFRIARHFSGHYQQYGPADNAEEISADLVFNSLVGHWFYPVRQIIHNIQQIRQLTRQQGYGLKFSESCLLDCQLSLFSTRTLPEQLQFVRKTKEQLEQRQQHFRADQIQQSSVVLLEVLAGTRSIPDQPVYSDGWQASALIMGAFWSDKQALWPELYCWEARLDNELPGYFVLSEIVFCTAMMRLILSQNEQQLSRRRQRVIEQQESRLEIWAQHCSDNFSARLRLIQAEKARILDQPPESLYEQAIAGFEQIGWPLHQALSFERYGAYLMNKQLTVLARFCLEKARRIYLHQGMLPRAKQLEHDLALLAK
ncbi:AraC family transcriptional regulator [Oceanospirillum sediminis]|uniref:AraC family transcriptional regulator ligand-binding domain-containing protein n=1 Tax=Oceanospirillum sediminis TaxID=2760088 RepID=A0A839ITS7_9GAMM|nr:AraC family transcriptional regulator [Oceanospirillum sediminis]MBB1487837.1 AraC family transcriptional regulator ligand-binding domain-containing protein [Oceanospirillum sediminis]